MEKWWKLKRAIHKYWLCSTVSKKVLINWPCCLNWVKSVKTILVLNISLSCFYFLEKDFNVVVFIEKGNDSWNNQFFSKPYYILSSFPNNSFSTFIYLYDIWSLRGGGQTFICCNNDLILHENPNSNSLLLWKHLLLNIWSLSKPIWLCGWSPRRGWKGGEMSGIFSPHLEAQSSPWGRQSWRSPPGCYRLRNCRTRHPGGSHS